MSQYHENFPEGVNQNSVHNEQWEKIINEFPPTDEQNFCDNGSEWRKWLTADKQSKNLGTRQEHRFDFVIVHYLGF